MTRLKEFNNSLWRAVKVIVNISMGENTNNLIIPGKTGKEIMKNYKRGYNRNKYSNFPGNILAALAFSIGDIYLQEKVDKLNKKKRNIDE
ncbi:MAG: hypothetical protein ACTSQY_11745 [Candidatus Odinarchaeia archaeon]